MNTEIYDKQKLVEYLLGSLSEDETERIDEASFIDESFADAISAAENDLIDDYVRGKLNGAKLEQFETHYLASPRRREKVKFAAAFQDLAELQTKPEKSEGFFAAFVNFLNANRLTLGFAGLILILIFGGWFFSVRQSAPEIVVKKSPEPLPINSKTNTEKNIEAAVAENPNSDMPQDREPININTNTANSNNLARKPTITPSPQTKITLASFVLAPPVRGNEITNLPIKKETTDIAVRLELEANDFSVYQVSLIDEAGRNLRQFGNLRSRGNSLNLRFSAKTLKSGIYSFAVSSVKDGTAEIISNYTFRVVIK